MKLNEVEKVEIIPTTPFHFDSTIFKPGHFASNDMKWKSGKRWQTFVWRGKKLGLILENKGIIEKPKIMLHIYSNKPLDKEFTESIVEEVKLRFCLDFDLKEFYNSVKGDPILKPIIKRFYGMRTMHHGSLYEYLVISILLQNATVRRSVNMMQTLFEHYGTLLEYNDQKLWCFWNPEDLDKVPEQELRALKVGYRAKSLIKASEAFAGRKIDESKLRKMDHDELEKELVKLYGVGPATVGIIMFDYFHRMDFLKHISPWEQKIYTRLFFNKDYEKELVPVDEMIKFFDKRWGKWKNLAINYVWEDLWWRRKKENIPWFEKQIRT